jgi:hypothetical protein
MSERPGTIRLPARDIAVPSTVSRQAQAVMASPPAQRAEWFFAVMRRLGRGLRFTAA